MPWVRAYCPVKNEARETAQIDVVTKLFSNSTPCSASRSTLGVWTIGLPAHPIASARWSSVKRNRMFGGRSVSTEQPGAARAAADMPRIKSRREGADALCAVFKSSPRPRHGRQTTRHPALRDQTIEAAGKGWVRTFGDALHRRMFVFVPRKGQDPPRAQDSSRQQVHERARLNFQADGRGNPRSMIYQSPSSVTTRCTACRR